MFYNQVGGVKCSLCGSEGTNKSTCPLNSDAVKTNPAKHPLALAKKDVKQVLPVKPVKQVSPVKPVKQVSPVKPASPAKTILRDFNKAQKDRFQKHPLYNEYQYFLTKVGKTDDEITFYNFLNIYNAADDIFYENYTGNEDTNKDIYYRNDPEGKVELLAKAAEQYGYIEEKQRSSPKKALNSVANVTNPEGLILLQSMVASMKDFSESDVKRFFDNPKSEKNLDKLGMRPFNKKELDTILAFSPRIRVRMLVSLDGDVEDVFVDASNKEAVTVRDVLGEFLANNQHLNQLASEEQNAVDPYLGDKIHFEGLNEIEPGYYDMSNFS